MINTVVLGYLYNEQRNQSAIDMVKTDSLIPATPVQQTQSNAPAAPVVPNTTSVPTTSGTK